MSDVLPPAPPRSDGGCWKWGAITCGVLGCLGILIVLGLAFAFFRSPLYERLQGTVREAQIVKRDMTAVKSALDVYVSERKSYPKRLEELIPRYLKNPAMLRPRVGGQARPFTYTRPPAGAPGSFPLLQYDLPSPVQEGPPLTMRMRKDGVFESGGYGGRSGSFGD